jgi:hypothetical protein
MAQLKSASAAPPPPSAGAETARGASVLQLGQATGSAKADIGLFAVKPPQRAQW